MKTLVKKLARSVKRWRKSWAYRLDSPWIRLLAYMDLQIVDHGFMRPFYNRPEAIAPGIYRSNQPSPAMIRKLAGQGFKSIISLRGQGANGAYLLEKEACEANNLNLSVIRLKSKHPPSITRIHKLKTIIDNVEKPALVHCKSGADRSGLAAALYLLITDTGSLEQAKSHLSLRYLHIKQARTGILDRFLEMYEEFNDKQPTPFMEWVDNHYSPKELKRSFKPKGWANWLVDGILRRE